jgi:hypothetical protein
MLTYYQVVNVFQSASLGHASINTFAEGDLDNLDSNSQNVVYPYIFLRPISSPGMNINQNGVSGTRTLTFELYSLDVPSLDESNRLTIMSNTEQFIYDIISYINRGDYQQVRWCTLNSITPVNEAFNDRVFGWIAVVNFNGPGVLDYCAYPPA